MANGEGNCRGLVLRSTDIGDHDKLLTVLTAERGKLTICAKGAHSLKSKYMPVSQQFIYGDYTFREKGEGRWLKEGSIVESFFSVRAELTRLAAASYMMGVAEVIALEEEPDPELLRLCLNSLHLLAADKYPVSQVKAVFELSAVSGAGFAPDLGSCADCGKRTPYPAVFDLAGGVVFCSDCVKKREQAARFGETEEGYSVPSDLTPGVADALRHILSGAGNPFAFRLPEEELRLLCDICERYLLLQLDMNFKTLDFYHEVTAS